MQRKRHWPQATPEYWGKGQRLRFRPSDGFWDCEQQHHGERRRITIRERTKNEAQIAAANAWLLIRREGWDAYDCGDPLLSKYIPWSVDKLLKRGACLRTVKEYVTGFEGLLRRDLGLDGRHKFGRAKSRDKKAERQLLYENRRVSYLTLQRVREWYQKYPTQAHAAKFLFQRSIVAQSPWRIKRPIPFWRGEDGDSAKWYPRPR